MSSPALPVRSRPKIGRNKLNTWLWGCFFVSPIVIGILVFSLYPVLYAIYISLTKWDGFTTPVFIGLKNFGEILGDKQILLEFANTLKYTVFVVPLTLMIAVVIANFLNTEVPAVSFFRVSFFLPVVTMPVAIAAVWKWLFHSSFGPFNILFRPFGLNPQWLGDPSYIMSAVIIVSIWSDVGYAAIILLAGLQNIPQNYYEAANIDGATAWQKFIKITIPLLSPTIFFLFITSTINALKAFDIIFMFAGASVVGSGGPTTEAVRTMVYGIYQKGFMLMNMGYAAAEAVVLFAFIFLVTALQFRLQKTFVVYDYS